MKRLGSLLLVASIFLSGLVVGLTVRFAPASAQSGCQTFPETGKTVCGRFLQYWQQHGGLAQQGYPISGEFTEKSDLDGKQYTVQYFERAVFEKHAENQPPYDVLLSQLGTFQLKDRYPNGAPASQPPAQATAVPTNPPAEKGPKIDVVSYTLYPAQGDDDAYVVGVARNAGSVQLGEPTIGAVLSDSAGNMLDESDTTGPIGMMPGDIWPFSIRFRNSPPGGANVQFSMKASQIGDNDKNDVYRDLKVIDQSVVPAGKASSAKVIGTVKNTGTATVGNIHVYILVTDNEGKVIDANYESADLILVRPGASTPFSVSTTAREVPHVQVVVYGWKW